MDMKKDIEELTLFIPKLKRELKQTNGSIKVKIDEDNFRGMLALLRKIKDQIKEPLNRADLIFTSVEEFDPVKLKEAIIKHASENG